MARQYGVELNEIEEVGGIPYGFHIAVKPARYLGRAELHTV